VSKPINLNRARKARASAAQKVQADRNAVKFGQPKATRQQADGERSAQQKRLDQHRLDPKP